MLAPRTMANEIPPYRQESLLIDARPEMSGKQILCTSPGLGQFAEAAAQSLPHASVTLTYFDQYRANLAREHWHSGPANLQIECAADLIGDNADVVALPLSSSGEAELTRELIQTSHERLKLGASLFVSTDNPADIWLGEQMQRVFRRVERRVADSGTLYKATKTEPLKRVRDFSCEFAFRDRGRLIRAFSRPGVFSHRHIDPGARRLIDAMEIAPESHVLDIGCGAGVVSLAAAFRAAGVQVHAVDSHTRAVECTRRGAALNDLQNLTAELNAAGDFVGTGSYDLALANPPYYAGFRIAEHFLTVGHEALRPRGQIIVVTKHADWYQENFAAWFEEASIEEQKGYFVVRGTKAT